MSRDGEIQIISLLQSIDVSLKIIAGTAPPDIIARFPEARASAARSNTLMEILIAGTIESAPEVAEPITVAVAETPLIENNTDTLMAIWVTNDHVAQSIWVAPMGVTVAAGRRVLPGTTVRFVLPPGASLFARCNLGTVPARVHRGFNIQEIMSEVVKG